jgi:predicted permease
MFTTVAVLSLALGIGVNTALFSFIDRLLLRSLPVRDPQMLALLSSPGAMRGTAFGPETFTYPAYKELNARNDVFDGVLAKFETPVSVTWKNATKLAAAELISGNYFEVLGLHPHVGRLISSSDDQQLGAHPVAVLGHGYWKRSFGEDTTVVGKKILLNGHPFEIVGVAPARFEGVQVGRDIQVYVPMSMKLQVTPTWNGLDSRNTWFLHLFARLKRGISLEQASARIGPLYRQILEEDLKVIDARTERFRQRYLDKKLLLAPGYQGRSDLRQQLGKPAIVLMCMVGLVLLIACANLANLLLARAAARQKEIAIRLSLGASRMALVRQLFTESLVIAVAGGAVGILMAVWAGDALMSFAPGANTETGNAEWSTPDSRVLLFNFVLSILTAMIFGLAPAWKATKPAVADTLKDQAGSVSSGVSDVRLRKGLVVAQISLSLLLLIGATLFARSLGNLKSLDPGFTADRLLTFTIDPSLSGYEKQGALDLLERIRSSVGSLPGVRAAGLTNNAVLAGNIAMATVNVEGYTPKEDENMNPDIASVSPNFFRTMGVRLIAGREFTEADRAGTQPVAIVNDAFARRFYAKESPIGRRIGRGGRSKPENVIVGVVSGFRNRSLRDEDRPMYFLPYLRDEAPSGYTFYVRASSPPAELANGIRREVQKLAPTVPVFEMRPMEAQIDQDLSIERAVAVMSGFFGVLAAVLAAIGLYGVMAFTVTRRTREIGIRVALGAERNTVLWLVLREVALMTVIGIGVGLPVAIALSRYVQSQLFGLSPSDPVTYAAAILAMFGIAALAGLIPANRASRLDPIKALRYE